MLITLWYPDFFSFTAAFKAPHRAASFAPQKLNKAPRLLDVGEMLCRDTQRKSNPPKVQGAAQAGLGWAAHPWALFELSFGCTDGAELLLWVALRREPGPAGEMSKALGSEGGRAQGMLPALSFWMEHPQHISAENFSGTAPRFPPPPLPSNNRSQQIQKLLR